MTEEVQVVQEDVTEASPAVSKDKVIQLTFTVEQIDALLGLLAELPYSKSVGFINEIYAQGRSQVAQEQKGE